MQETLVVKNASATIAEAVVGCLKAYNGTKEQTRRLAGSAHLKPVSCCGFEVNVNTPKHESYQALETTHFLVGDKVGKLGADPNGETIVRSESLESAVRNRHVYYVTCA